MNGSAEIETDRNALKRIVAVLFALADLADCAAGRPWAVRRLVLSILYLAEEAAHAFVTGSAGATDFVSPPPPSAVPAPPRAGPIDAMRLALSFRALALAVCAMLASRSRGRSRHVGHIIAGAHQAGSTGLLSACPSQERQAAALPGPAIPGSAFDKRPDTS